MRIMDESNLHSYQRACVEHIIRTPFCGVFLEMGLGKTVSTLTAINYLIYDYLEVSKVLVIAPKRVAETVWQEEAEQWEVIRAGKFLIAAGDLQAAFRFLKGHIGIQAQGAAESVKAGA